MKSLYFIFCISLFTAFAWGQPANQHEMLHPTLWTQTSAEHDAVSLQIYKAAMTQLDRALADSSWTAVLGQTGSFSGLPPAVVLLVDETVLDNHGYEAYLTASNTGWDPDSWSRWVNAREAEAKPGALEFVQYAVSKGVNIFYVSDRDPQDEPATADNLRALGFPVEADGSNILSTYEETEWGYEKMERHERIAQTHRVLLLFGYDLHDFLPGSYTDPKARRALANQYDTYWGEKWFILPNDMYGGWEDSLFNYESLSRGERIAAKFSQLELEETICPPGTDPFPRDRNHEILHSVLYIQTSGEYQALALQTYNIARLRLQEALADPNWTAALEQTGDYQNFPPAVLLDVDETTLDNAAFDACMAYHNTSFSPSAWSDWVALRKAKGVPGAAEFSQFAATQGVEIFYLSNRNLEQEPDTLANLLELGFAVEADGSTLLSSGEQEGWGGDKTTRRSYVAQNYRILLSIGDDANNFLTGTRLDLQARNAMIAEYADHWGEKWIALPNTMYGDWEGTLYHFESLSPAQIRDAKLDALDVPQSMSPSSFIRYEGYE